MIPAATLRDVWSRYQLKECMLPMLEMSLTFSSFIDHEQSPMMTQLLNSLPIAITCSLDLARRSEHLLRDYCTVPPSSLLTF